MAAVNEANGNSPVANIPAVSARGTLTQGLMALALLLAAAGQLVLLKINRGAPTADRTQAIGGILLVVGALVFGLASMRVAMLDSWPGTEASRAGADIPLWRPVLIVAAAVELAAVVLFATIGESPAVVWLWLAGMVLLVASSLRGARLQRLQLQPNQWLMGLGLAVLLVIAVISRTWHLTTLPYNFDGDFGSWGLQARDLATGVQKNLFAYGWAGIPMMAFVPASITMRLFGTGLAGLNASGVIEGVLIVAGVYLLGRELFSARVGLLAAAVLVVSYTDMAVSRQSQHIEPILFMTWAAYLLFIGFRRSRGWAALLGGMCSALSLEMYYSGRLIGPLLMMVLLHMLIFERRRLFAQWRLIALGGAGSLFGLGPMLAVILRNPAAFMVHQSDMLVLRQPLMEHMMGVYKVSTVAAVMLQQVRHTALLFNYYTDTGTIYALGLPYLDPYTGVLFALGLGYVLFHLRRPGSWTLLWWILIALVFGSILTLDPPTWSHLMVMLPPVALLCALGLEALYRMIEGALPRMGPAAATLPILLIVGFGLLGVRNWNAYVDSKGAWGSVRTRIARFMADQPPTATAYLVSQGCTYKDREFAYLIPGRLLGNLTPEQAVGPIATNGSPTLLIADGSYPDVVQQLAARYPSYVIPGNSPGEVTAHVFEVP